MLCGCQTTKTTKAGSSKTVTTSASKVSMGAINDKCPDTGKPVDPQAGTTTWRGHTIGFCCPKCIKPFEAMSPKDKDDFVAKYTKP